MFGRVLVVWSEVPEDVWLVVLEDAALEHVRRFHNVYINGNFDQKLIDDLSKFFYDAKTAFRYQKIASPLFDVQFDLVILTGFIL